jgi:hypothetical protein
VQDPDAKERLSQIWRSMLVISAVGFDFNRMIGRLKEWLQISWDYDRTSIRPGDAFVVLGKKIDGNDIGIVLEPSRKDIYSRAGLCHWI